MYVYKGIVVRVYDGDTVTLDVDLGFGSWLKKQTFRLYGVNTPELRGEDKVRGYEARDWLRSQIPNGVEVKIETFKDKKGKYGRWLARIQREYDEITLNDKLIEMGYPCPPSWL